MRVPIFIVLAAACSAALSAQAPAPPATAPTGRSAPPTREPTTLTEMLEVALQSNPEVLQAEAAVRQAQADLNQVRLKVTQDVISAFHERQKFEELVKSYEAQLELWVKRFETGTASPGELQKARAELAQAKASLAQTGAVLRYFMGARYPETPRREGAAAPAAPAPSVPAIAAPRSPPEVPEALRSLLRVNVRFRLAKEQSLGDAFENLSKITRVNFVVDEDLGRQLDLDEALGAALELSDMTLRNVLLALADRFGTTFVLRDYGVFVTTPEKATLLRSVSIPPQDENLDRRTSGRGRSRRGR